MHDPPWTVGPRDFFPRFDVSINSECSSFVYKLYFISITEYWDFVATIETFPLGTTDLAMEIKRRGKHVSRQLSFKNATLKVEHVPLPTGTHFIRLYELYVKLWVELRIAFNMAADFIGVDEKPRQIMWSQFFMLRIDREGFVINTCFSHNISLQSKWITK